jgi:hypothetical protein
VCVSKSTKGLMRTLMWANDPSCGAHDAVEFKPYLNFVAYSEPMPDMAAFCVRSSKQMWRTEIVPRHRHCGDGEWDEEFVFYASMSPRTGLVPFCVRESTNHNLAPRQFVTMGSFCTNDYWDTAFVFYAQAASPPNANATAAANSTAAPTTTTTTATSGAPATGTAPTGVTTGQTAPAFRAVFAAATGESQQQQQQAHQITPIVPSQETLMRRPSFRFRGSSGAANNSATAANARTSARTSAPRKRTRRRCRQAARSWASALRAPRRTCLCAPRLSRTCPCGNGGDWPTRLRRDGRTP